MKPTMYLLPFSLLLLTSCGNGQRQHPAAAPQAAPVKAELVAVSSESWPGGYEATGTVKARTTGTISSKVMGYVQQVNARVGDRVRQGQVLITLDARDLESNVRRAAAGRAEVQSAIPEADNAIRAAQANLELAQSTYQRLADLAAKKSISSQELDEASARLKGAIASHEMARARRSQLDSKAAQAEQEFEAASIMRDYSRIAAPFAGLITARSVEPGNLASPGTPLLTIEQEGSFRLEAPVDESRLPSVRPGSAVQVALEASGKAIGARVAEVVPSVDPGSRTYLVKIDLPAVADLRSGAFGRAIFPTAAEQVLAIPATAVMDRGQLQSVFVAEDGVARLRMVTTGRRRQDVVEVLSGLNLGEKVVRAIPQGLQDGVRLEVR